MTDQSAHEQLVADLAHSLYAILANYEREGAGPGSRFEGQTCEYAQAKFAVRTVLYWRRSQEVRLEQAAIARAENLRDKWLAWPDGDIHHAAGLMLACYLDGTAYGSDEPRPAALDGEKDETNG